MIDEITGFRIDEIPEQFEHPHEKSKQFPDSECPYCYIESQRRYIADLEQQLSTLREAIKYALSAYPDYWQPYMAIRVAEVCTVLRAALEVGDE